MSQAAIPFAFPVILAAAALVSFYPGEETGDGRVRRPEFRWGRFVRVAAALSAFFLFCLAAEEAA